MTCQKSFSAQSHSGPPLLKRFEDYLLEGGKGYFRPGLPVTAARAPGRIDVMGGIADYSGSVVLEGTLGRAAVLACQERGDRRLRVRSTLLEEQGLPCEVELPLEALREGGRPASHEQAREVLAREPERAWAAYVLGAAVVLEREGMARLNTGMDFLLWSDVPIGVGVASSAAVEVATMYALTNSLGVELQPERLAALAQVVENSVVGAPCGIMDQVTSALGEAGKLLALRCQPCEVLDQVELPPDLAVFGISSRVEHRVGGKAYARARASAFMGLKIILAQMQALGMPITERGRYLCNITPQQYRETFRHVLPESVRGSEFTARWGETPDSVTSVAPDETYSVRAATEHPIYENQRVQAFIECIERARAGDTAALLEAGGLMGESHSSYGHNCGLGCRETDLIADLARARGPAEGIYGARITGGGCGGTVAVLARKDAAETVRAVAAGYEAQTGIRPDIFDSTSPGAYALGPCRYVLEL